MPSLRNEQARNTLIRRVQALTPETRPHWGKLNAPRLIPHLIDGLTIALGEKPAASVNRKVFQRFPLKHLIIYVLPFPKGAPTTKEFLSTSPGDFETDRRTLVELINRLATTKGEQRPMHPLFGALTFDEWNALQWKHIAHHMKQFGC